jgi:hypothetical protein
MMALAIFLLPLFFYCLISRRLEKLREENALVAELLV